MKVEDIIKSQQLKLIFEFKNNGLPPELQKLFKFTNQKHSYETTSATKEFLFIPHINTVSHGNMSIKYKGPYLWNEICKNNPTLNNVKSIFQLKKFFKKYFLSQYSLLI